MNFTHQDYKEFLVNQFKQLEIETKVDEWKYVKTFKIEENAYEHKLSHNILGFLDIKENDSHLSCIISILSIFRRMSRQNDNELTKHLFSLVVKYTNNPNMSFYQDLETNLTNAIEVGNIELIKFLVENGVSINSENDHNIIVALQCKQYEIASYFLNNEPKIDKNRLIESIYIDEEMRSFINNYETNQKLHQELKNSTITQPKQKI